ncbi:UDP-glucuronic acid decarboxylase family protein [Sinorhizobium terangae]|uniref:NAD-dependent epimerase/dehydratase family protein n=1 Tax=Sinorhizobium terangae TaxID=110322 RepID=A0A6N7L9W8_SINTE|nr:UDP-glucuronic acid decarboxylase family protein [Sinorhizobium terangae]MBB4188580.1 UDP-glucuronate decarboxylase [Sinorhizobium terangae]MQX14611.1 NAD-dependent epimerase/dehydratase family protein [Sinorhizobium terangae]WFU49802.1 SDR family oxidoreductase [Sinorhizobium terangae]
MNYFRNDFRKTLPSLNEGNDFPRRPKNLKRILVTGGAGFLGSHLCELLLGAGHEVICVDNFSTGLRRNIAQLKRFDTFRVIAHDIVEPIDLEVDEIYNLACPASPPHYQADPIQTMRTCVVGSLNLLDLAARRGARIFQASTSEIYGDPQVHPQVESYWGNVNPFGPRSCYDEGKRCAETLFHDFHKVHGVEIKIVRIFNTYGPRMRPDDGRVVSNFIVQALKGEDITIHGDGSQTRSFCFVDDLIDGFVRLMASPSALTGPVNLGNPGEFTISELAEQVIHQTGSRSKIVRRPLPVDDPRQRRPDISLATEALGWRPTVNLSEGLARTIGYFDGLLSGSDRKVMELV